MCSDTRPVIEVAGVSKHYAMFNKPSDRLKQMLSLGKRQYFSVHKALEDVSFCVGAGESVGIIGHNGSGKSTLLQIISGTLTPTGGTVNVHGRVAALLELGAGFNPDFTGKENVFLYGAVLGLSQEEMAAKYDDICEFADIGEFMHQPLTCYSSGMIVRLAFAVSTAVDPDILIVDEALAVGDEAFQRKCFGRIQELRAKGCTLLFVSHSVVAVSEICTHVCLMDHGEMIAQGAPAKVIAQYQALLHAQSDRRGAIRAAIMSDSDMPMDDVHEDVPDSCVIYPEAGARIEGVHIENAQGETVTVLEKGKKYSLCYSVTFLQHVTAPLYGVMIRTIAGAELAGGFTKETGAQAVREGQKVRIAWGFRNMLNQGVYYLSSGVLEAQTGEARMMHRIVDGLEFRVVATKESVATARVDLEWDVKATPWAEDGC